MIGRLLPAALAFALVPCLAGCPGARPRDASPPPPASERTPQIAFADVTEAAGLRFEHYTGADGRYFMPESVGPGGAFLDYDADGWLDIFLVNSSNWPDRPAAGRVPALYRNQRDGTFRDVTREAGLAAGVYGQGCAVGDFDNDGWDDLLLTCVGPNRLFHNRRGRFVDVTRAAGVGDGPRWAWHTSAAWVDYDRDGLLDLFVCRYVKWSPETDITCRNGNGKETYCGPTQYSGEAADLYRNLGGGRFRNVSRETGIAGAPGKGLGVVPVDENEDGWPDMFVSNDLVRNHLWRSEGGRRFREAADEAGVAVADNGRARAGMGLDLADTRNDGGLAIGIGNFSGEGLALFDRAGGMYTDRGGSSGLLQPSLRRLTFGLVFLDANLDGWEDLFAYNGHVDPHFVDLDGRPNHRQMPQLFANRNGAFADVTEQAGPPIREPQVGRGCARGDFDNDGRPDLLLCPNGDRTRLLRNVSPDDAGWLGVRLVGRAGNRNGYGAEVRLTAGGRTQRRWIRSGGSYLSHSDTRALFGLGGATPDRIEVRWPGGQVSVLASPAAGAYHEMREP
jgi:hypothetical protein